MPKKDDDYIISETKNWNVAAEYAKEKIMEHLKSADSYYLTAIYGTIDFREEQIMGEEKGRLRIQGFEWLVSSLLLIIDNTLFAVKKQREEFLESQKELKRVQKIIPLLYSIKKNHINKTQRLSIKEDTYSKILERVSEIKSEMNGPLNKNHLIFTDTEEFDPKAFKNTLKDRMINQG